MIKESKLIGTKMTMPYGWREFKVGDLFDIMSTHALNYDLLQPNGDYPYVVRSAQNNGIREFMNYDTAFLNEGNVITLGIDTATYFYQASDFFAGANVKSLRLKYYELNSRIAMFLIPLLQKQAGDYGYAGGKAFKTAELAEVLIELPVTQDGQPDYGWMSSYILELENQRIRELDTYLQVTGLVDTTLTDNELQVLEQWRQHEKFGGMLLTKRFRVSDLFDVSRGDISNQNLLVESDAGTPLVLQNDANNGVDGRRFIHKGRVFDASSMVIGRQTGVMYTIPYDFITTDGVLVLTYDDASELSNLFIISLLKSTMSRYGFTNTVSVKKLNELSIELPVTNDGTPDYDFMQTFIRAQEKRVMQRLDKFRQLQIDTTKAVI